MTALHTKPISIRKSVTDDFSISLEDGERYRPLERRLAAHGLTPAEYRAKRGLPDDCPTVSPAHASPCSELAKSMGLGAMRRKR